MPQFDTLARLYTVLAEGTDRQAKDVLDALLESSFIYPATEDALTVNLADLRVRLARLSVERT